jgi:rubrerythrin
VATEMNRSTAAEGATTEVLDGLNDLLQLDHDALAAYEIAIEKLEDRDAAAQIAGFKRDHERHIAELNELIAALGGTPANKPHATGVLKTAMQRLGGLGGDKGILISWRANELQVRTKYDSYASKAVRWPHEVKRLIDRNALDEERHYHWVADLLDRMGVAPGEGIETDLATRAREAGARVSYAAENLGTRARSGVADGLDNAADRIGRLGDPAAEGAQARVAGAARRVAGGIHSTADYVREGETPDLQAAVEDRVRQRPLRTLLTLFGVGFVVGRLLR